MSEASIGRFQVPVSRQTVVNTDKVLVASGKRRCGPAHRLSDLLGPGGRYVGR